MSSSNANANVSTPVPFPHPESTQLERSTTTTTNTSSPVTRQRTATNASTISNRLRSGSIAKLMEASPPPGMWAATGTFASKAPTLGEIRRGSFSESGWNEESQRQRAERRASVETGTLSKTPSRVQQSRISKTGSMSAAAATGGEPFAAVTEEESNVHPTVPEEGLATEEDSHPVRPVGQQDRKLTYGYRPPPKVPWTRSTAIALKAFWKFFLTWTGFLITIYGLNVVAWGGMLFLLLCNASPAMCRPSCNDIQSPRRIWIEIDSQILNALFCVTGFGLAPWRIRDLYWWAWWRLGGQEQRKQTGIRRLAGIHRGWFRLPGSDLLPEDASAKTVDPLDPAVPIPVSTTPDPPPTGIHAPPTKGWKMDFVLWMNMSNTFFQIVLCFFMWHFNRYKRPSWATGLFVAMGCIVAGVGGIMMFHEGKYVKKVEGVPVAETETGLGDDVEMQDSNNDKAVMR